MSSLVCVALFKVQDVVPITSCDTAGSFLLLGCNNGSIYYIGTHIFIQTLMCVHTSGFPMSCLTLNLSNV